MEQTTAATKVNWRDWLDRWHRQQEGYLPQRELRFELMMDYIEQQRGNGSLRLLDLGSGPGSISEVALRRFPQSSIVAIDKDPWLIEMGRQTLGIGGQVDWREEDLRFDEWIEKYEPGSFDAVFSATALHWLHPDELARLYRNLAILLAEGGLFLNADHMTVQPGRVFDLNKAELQKWQTQEFARTGAENWEQYWQAAQAEPAFNELLAEREHRFANRTHVPPIPVEWHRQTLQVAGFRETGEIWRYYNDSILLAIR